MKMLPEKFLTYFLYFSAMAFVGRIIESVYRSYYEKKFVNAGFLSGPFLSIYGFDAVIITSINTEVRNFPVIFSWIITLLSPTALEYFGSCFILDIDHSARTIINFKDFQNNILKLIEKGKKFTPGFDFSPESEHIHKKLPNEVRRLSKPLNAFLSLRRGFREKSFVFPEWVNEILERRFKK
jgi:hypothetical protein